MHDRDSKCGWGGLGDALFLVEREQPPSLLHIICSRMERENWWARGFPSPKSPCWFFLHWLTQVCSYACL